ncbi:MAG: RNA methyltransferase [Clostridia bacterium]|nr:RNA methyltransferase [Clostridia bacterium]
MNTERITSRANPLVKALRALAAERKTREKEQKFFCEGETMLAEALASGCTPCEILCAERTDTALLAKARERGSRIVFAADEIVSHCASVVSAQTVVFTLPIPSQTLPCGERLLLLDGVADPGNVGTILRTAEAFALDGVIFCGNCADRYAPKVVRATMGATFRLPTWTMTAEAALAHLRALNLPVYATTLSHDSVDVATVDLTRGCIILGNEANGVSVALQAAADKRIHIPMRGRAESLNVAIAAGIVCYRSAM